MKTIFYSVCGEGLGHCSRALVLIKNMPDYHFYLFASGDGANLARKMTLPNLRVIEINSVRFANTGGKINGMATVFNFMKFWFKDYEQNRITITAMLNLVKPDLCIVDWEPSLAYICHSEGIKYVSIDSQHKFKFTKPVYSLGLNIYQALASLFCRFYIPRPAHNIVSTFQSSLIKETEQVTPVQCLIDPSYEDVEVNDYVVIYCKFKEIADKIVSALIENGQKVICYGAESIEHKNVIYKKQDKEAFAKDLRNCKAVFSTAGVQLVGEAAYYGKPIFVVPLPNQYEQYINGADVESLKLGTCSELSNITPASVGEFLSEYSGGINPLTNGLQKTINILETYIA
jgi:uncharacterized protein (TIGR00661 family)